MLDKDGKDDRRRRRSRSRSRSRDRRSRHRSRSRDRSRDRRDRDRDRCGRPPCPLATIRGVRSASMAVIRFPVQKLTHGPAAGRGPRALIFRDMIAVCDLSLPSRCFNCRNDRDRKERDRDRSKERCERISPRLAFPARLPAHPTPPTLARTLCARTQGQLSLCARRSLSPRPLS